MIALNQFNSLCEDEAARLLAPCVAIPAWSEMLVSLRPFASRHALLQVARKAMANWGEDELNAALSAHPRIGEKPTGSQAHAALSRQEQSSVDSENERLAQALREGNARYEARFGRVFLIRA
ncbi:2-oxo-4-hydroxy-4-carboxy-5-ureidoimidazoline decarboxylase, partial [Klebsiella pneumoniae]